MKYCPQCQRSFPNTQRFCLEDGALLSLKDPYNFVGRNVADKYRIEALVGMGGMGAVYSAHQIGIDRRVAFKILLPNLVVGNERMISLFEREAKTAGQLFHENIAIVFDAGRTADDVAYIAMEWLDGQTLEAELATRGPLSFERTAELLRQIVAALDAAHAKHIIHRDLKPSNVMLIKRSDGRDQVKVLDFGIAKVVSETTDSPVSALMGTPHYASPEQFQLGARIDGRTDIYSLGVMLYQMLTGALPFNAPSIHELVRLHMTAPPPPLRQLRPEVPIAVEQLISRMLAKDPEQRPQQVGEIPALFDLALNRPAERPAETPINREPPTVRETATEKNAKPPDPTAFDRHADSLRLKREAEIRRAQPVYPPPQQPWSPPPRARQKGSKILLIFLAILVPAVFVTLLGAGYGLYLYTSRIEANKTRQGPYEAPQAPSETPSKSESTNTPTPVPTNPPPNSVKPEPTPIPTLVPRSDASPPTPQTQPPRYIARCVFYGDPNAYYVTSNNDLVGVNSYGQAVYVGKKIPPTVTGFVWMYATAAVTYGVDSKGMIWSRYPNGVPFIVGYVTNL